MVEVVKFKDFLRFSLKCFSISGQNPLRDKNDKTLKAKLKSFYYFLFVVSSVSIFPLGAVSILKNFDDILVLTRIMPLLVLILLVMAKSLMILYRRNSLMEIVKTSERLFLTNAENQAKLKVRNHLNSLQRIERGINRLGVSVLALFLIVNVIQMISTGNIIQKLPVELWFPFDAYDPKFHFCVFFWLSWISLLSFYTLLGADMFCYAMISLISIQYEHLCKRLDDLNQIPKEKLGSELKDLVKLHNELIKVAETLESIFSFPIFVNFFGGSLLICYMGFQIVDGADYENSVRYAGLLTSVMSQIFLLCYFGTKFTEDHEMISNKAFNSNWFEIRDKNIKHVMLLMIMRSQKSSALTAMKFTTISLSFRSCKFKTKKYVESFCYSKK